MNYLAQSGNGVCRNRSKGINPAAYGASLSVHFRILCDIFPRLSVYFRAFCVLFFPAFLCISVLSV